MSAVIEVEDLRKEYRRLRAVVTTALAGIAADGIMAFLGSNDSDQRRAGHRARLR